MNNKMTIKEIHDKHLSMLIKFDKFCTMHNLNYFLAHGTLLGAIRHKGFIPWDDDVDILMPRPDYEKLLAHNKITDDLIIVSNKNEDYYHPFPYANINDTNTIMVEHQLKNPTGKGVFLDIFPLDGCPKNRIIRTARAIKLKILSKAYSQKILLPRGTKNWTLRGIEKVISWYFKNLSEYDLIRKLIETAKKCKYEENEMVWIGSFLDNDTSKNIYPKLNFSKHIMHPFENSKFRIPIGYDDCLLRSYGDYMKLPDIEDRVGHHEIIYLWKTN